MRRKFAEGLLFGAGFALAFVIVQLLVPSLLLPLMFESSEHQFFQADTASSNDRAEVESGRTFHELPVEEQIQRASVIALARFEPTPDGRQKAVISEILKQTPGTAFYYSVGDEFAHGSFYPREGTEYGDGLVIFFVGSPASMRMSMTYSGDRIRSLGDIPLKLFREKCARYSNG